MNWLIFDMASAPQPSPDRRPWTQTGLPLVAIAGAVFLVFGRALGFDFLLWDDDIQLTGNPTLQRLDWPTAQHMFAHGYAIRYQPLSWLSSALIAKLAGLRPFPFHAYNVLVHALSATLLAALIRQLVAPAEGAAEENHVTVLWASVFGALAWALHPLRVEPVVWATGWRYCQSVALMLTSALLYLRAVRRAPEAVMRTGAYWLAVVAFALSAFSYPFCLEWPLVLVLLDVYPLARWRSRAAWLDKLPFAALSAFVLTVAIIVRNTTKVADYLPATWAEYGPVSRLMKAFTVWANAILRTCLPFDLGPIYPQALSVHAISFRSVASAVVLLGLTVVLVRFRRRHPLLLVLWLAHLVLLGSKLGLLEVGHIDADRYTYPAGMAWAALVTAGYLALGRHPLGRRARLPLVVALLGALGIMSFRQSSIWRNDTSFFPAALAKAGSTGPRGDLVWRLALAEWRDGNLPAALSLFDEAVGLRPDDLRARLMRTKLLQQLGRTQEAYREMSEVMRLTGASTAEEAHRIISQFVRGPNTDFR